jgi:SPP1 family predicted phage head-tail adaptor
MSLSGHLNKRVTIQRKSDAQDSFGQPGAGQAGGDWVDVATVWAGIKDMTGRQYFASQAAQNPVQTEISIRFREGIVPSMRVLHGSDAYDIEAVLGQDRRTLKLMCSRGVSDG